MRVPLLLAAGAAAALLVTGCGATTDAAPAEEAATTTPAPPAEETSANTPALPVEGDSEELVELVEEVLGDVGPTSIAGAAIVKAPANVPPVGDIVYEPEPGDVALKLMEIEAPPDPEPFARERFGWEAEVVGKAVAARARDQGLPRVAVLIAGGHKSVLRPPEGPAATEADVDEALETIEARLEASGAEAIETKVVGPYGLAATLVLEVDEPSETTTAMSLGSWIWGNGFDQRRHLYVLYVDEDGTPFYELAASGDGTSTRVGNGYEGCVPIKGGPFGYEPPPCPLEAE